MIIYFLVRHLGEKSILWVFSLTCWGLTGSQHISTTLTILHYLDLKVAAWVTCFRCTYFEIMLEGANGDGAWNFPGVGQLGTVLCPPACVPGRPFSKFRPLCTVMTVVEKANSEGTINLTRVTTSRGPHNQHFLFADPQAPQPIYQYDIMEGTMGN